jgi:hypothetical protein
MEHVDDLLPVSPWWFSVYPELVEYQASSRFPPRFPLSPRSFLFYEYMYLFDALFLKIQDYDTFPFSRLVDIQLNGLICWTVGLNGVI